MGDLRVANGQFNYFVSQRLKWVLRLMLSWPLTFCIVPRENLNSHFNMCSKLSFFSCFMYRLTETWGVGCKVRSMLKLVLQFSCISHSQRWGILLSMFSNHCRLPIPALELISVWQMVYVENWSIQRSNTPNGFFTFEWGTSPLSPMLHHVLILNFFTCLQKLWPKLLFKKPKSSLWKNLMI